MWYLSKMTTKYAATSNSELYREPFQGIDDGKVLNVEVQYKNQKPREPVERYQARLCHCPTSSTQADSFSTGRQQRWRNQSSSYASFRTVVREEETSYTEGRELFWARSCLDMHEASQLVYSHILTVFCNQRPCNSYHRFWAVVSFCCNSVKPSGKR